MSSRKILTALGAAIIVASCGSSGLSTAEAEEAAKQRVRESLGLAQEAALFSDVFVGEPVDGGITLCGTVSGTKADGTQIAPRRFIVAAENAEWLKFEPVDGNVLPSQPDKFAEWHTTCTGEAEV